MFGEQTPRTGGTYASLRPHRGRRTFRGKMRCVPEGQLFRLRSFTRKFTRKTRICIYKLYIFDLFIQFVSYFDLFYASFALYCFPWTGKTTAFFPLSSGKSAAISFAALGNCGSQMHSAPQRFRSTQHRFIQYRFSRHQQPGARRKRIPGRRTMQAGNCGVFRMPAASSAGMIRQNSLQFV